jgi:hypothetical protein
MSYRNKTYVIFDGDNDMWAYAFMRGWIKNEHIEFNFYDAHEIKKINENSSEDTVKRTLRLRLANAKQGIVLVGESTRYLFKFVRWEIETCLDLGLPLVVVNLNDKREFDEKLCPPIIKDTASVHVPFRAAIIRHSLDEFCSNFSSYKNMKNLRYPDELYKNLGLP